MDDDELLRRFAALKGTPSTAPARIPAPTDESTPSQHVYTAPYSPNGPSRHIAAAARRAEREDDALSRLAEGRPLDLDSLDADTESSGISGEGIEWGDVKGEHERRKAEERTLRDRLKGLGGDRWATRDVGGQDGVEEWDFGAGEGDDEVRWAPLSCTCGLSGTCGRKELGG